MLLRIIEIELINLVTRKVRLRWFGLVEHKIRLIDSSMYDNGAEVDEQGRMSKKTWWNCVKDDMKTFGLPQEMNCA